MSTQTAVPTPTKQPQKLSPKLITGEELYAMGDIGPMVWVVDPQLEQVHVFRAPEQMKLLRKQEMLTGEDVLPGFQVALTEIFAAA